MPKIAPRVEITTHPLYQETMAAQHLAYQIMRGVPADRKADATRLHKACVHATTFAQYALDSDVGDPKENYEGMLEAVGRARMQLGELMAVAGDANDAEALMEKLAELEKKATEALGGPA